MVKIKIAFSLLILGLAFTSCSDSDDIPNFENLTLNLSGLEDLGSDYVYEGWIIVDGSPITTGRFSIDGTGNASQNTFSLDYESLTSATTFILTIEPAVGDSPTPSSVHILAGDFSGNTGNLSISHAAALGNDYVDAAREYILATPTNGAGTNENRGIWFLSLDSGSPAAGLKLPTLPAGWKYEGWTVINGIPVTTGTFTAVDMVDNFEGFSSTMGGRHFQERIF